jgi:hypothetical protein
MVRVLESLLRVGCNTIVMLNGLREEWSSLSVQDMREGITKSEALFTESKP